MDVNLGDTVQPVIRRDCSPLLSCLFVTTLDLLMASGGEPLLFLPLPRMAHPTLPSPIPQDQSRMTLLDGTGQRNQALLRREASFSHPGAPGPRGGGAVCEP